MFKIYKEAENMSRVFFFVVVAVVMIFLQPVPGTAGIVTVRNLYRR